MDSLNFDIHDNLDIFDSPDILDRPDILDGLDIFWGLDNLETYFPFKRNPGGTTNSTFGT